MRRKSTGGEFGEALGGGRTLPPEEFSPAQWEALRAWAEEKMPWLSRGALGSVRSLEAYVDEVFDWGRSNAKRKADWLATVRNWVRNDETERLGSDPVGLEALRSPAVWRDAFDARRRAVEVAPTEGSGALVRPEGGSVHKLERRGGQADETF